jgi:CRISPR-associated protein Csx14
MTTTFDVDLDVRNPGQFFAGCGLLELAERRWPGCVASVHQDHVHIEAPGDIDDPLGQIVRSIVDATPLFRPTHDAASFEKDTTKQTRYQKVPITLVPYGIRIDWWLKPGGANDTTPLRFWAGQQVLWAPDNPKAISMQLQKALAQVVREGIDRTILSKKVPLPSRIGFDASASWDGLSVGYSPNKVGLNAATSPAAELLGLIGLQGFRPVLDGTSLVYVAWQGMLPTIMARVAVGGALPRTGRRFRVGIQKNGKNGYLGYADEMRMDK